MRVGSMSGAHFSIVEGEKKPVERVKGIEPSS